MTRPQQSTPDELVARCLAHTKADEPAAPEVLELAEAEALAKSERVRQQRTQLRIVPPPVGDDQADDEHEPRFAGSDADAMFDLDEYGGRLCAQCRKSIDNKRGDSRYCTDACRSKSWRNTSRANRNPHS